MLRRAGWAHFNSRPSARGDASCTLQIVSLTRFQFTPLREGRPHKPAPRRSRGAFQFTPLREGRQGLQLFQESLKHFNSRPSARGDSASQYNPRIIDKFQFTPLREGRLPRKQSAMTLRRFQFTPLREGRQAVGAMPTYRAYFNSRPSARGDTTKRYFPQNKIFQFTPLRKGRPPTFTPDAEKLRISIHAPPRGATDEGKIKPPAYYISIHAPPRGATSASRRCQKVLCHFNSRPSARGDVGKCLACISPYIFQFTPLREGRQLAYHGLCESHDFNSRPSARGDHIDNACDPRYTFQFTPLREGRRQQRQ